MSKYRVYELAKEFKTESKVVLNLLERNGHAVKNHMSSVGDEEREMLRNIFSGEAARQARQKAEQKKAEQPPKTDKPADQKKCRYRWENGRSAACDRACRRGARGQPRGIRSSW